MFKIVYVGKNWETPGKPDCVTVGKVYNCIGLSLDKFGDTWFRIVDDTGIERSFGTKRWNFSSIKEYRKNKLNKIYESTL